MTGFGCDACSVDLGRTIGGNVVVPSCGCHCRLRPGSVGSCNGVGEGFESLVC